jgi:hypothetical protein
VDTSLVAQDCGVGQDGGAPLYTLLPQRSRAAFALRSRRERRRGNAHPTIDGVRMLGLAATGAFFAKVSRCCRTAKISGIRGRDIDETRREIFQRHDGRFPAYEDETSMRRDAKFSRDTMGAWRRRHPPPGDRWLALDAVAPQPPPRVRALPLPRGRSPPTGCGVYTASVTIDWHILF